MKKIIATVLAMVMALALCTVAFAADVTYTITDSDGNDAGSAVLTTVDAKYKVNQDETYNTVEGYTFSNRWFVKADKSDYSYKFSAPGKADLYLTEVNSLNYKAKAVVFTNIGDGCGQISGNKSDTYYKATWENADEETEIGYYVKAANGSVNLLVDGKLVRVNAANDPNGHTWKAATYDEDDNVTTYKCKDCGTVATVYKTKDAAAASGAAVWTKPTTGDAAGKWIAWTDGTTKPADSTNKSPKTFDAGIAMYVGMALTSVAGSAVVIGKKKEF